jgi:type I restriction enzyme M protein
MPANHTEIEKRLWDAADELRANSRLRASEYSVPVLGLIFLKYADRQLKAEPVGKSRRRGALTPEHYQRRGVLYLPGAARFQALVDLPESANVGRAINNAMKAIEDHNEALKDVLPKTYLRFENATLRELLRIFNGIPMDVEQGWSLNPGRYVGVAERTDAEDEDFAGRLEVLDEELERLNAEAHELEARIAENVAQLLNNP